MMRVEALKAEEKIFEEYRAYEKMKRKLLERYEGKVVVIRDGKLVGVYESEEEALKDVLGKYGLEPVLIKRVVRKEGAEQLPSYMYGLTSVNLG